MSKHASSWSFTLFSLLFLFVLNFDRLFAYDSEGHILLNLLFGNQAGIKDGLLFDFLWHKALDGLVFFFDVDDAHTFPEPVALPISLSLIKLNFKAEACLRVIVLDLFDETC